MNWKLWAKNILGGAKQVGGDGTSEVPPTPQPMLINMMKCPKHGWFHGGSTGWICPRCSKEKAI